MDITFDLSHLLSTGGHSPASERVEVSNVILCAFKALQASYSRHHPGRKALARSGVVVPSLGSVTWKLDHVFHPNASKVEEAETLRILLDCLTNINLIYLKHHPYTPSLYKTGVVYGRTEIWDPIPALYKRTYGDCKSLSAARIAELLHRKIAAQPTFRFNPRMSGAKDFHILVQTTRGFEDPSRKLGMGQNENAYFQRSGQ